MKSNTICKNCGASVAHQYCGHCGQQVVVKRWRMKRLWRSAFSSVFDTEKGFGFTFKSLLLRPGRTIDSYLNGRTVVYTNPFKYLAFASLANIVLGSLIEIKEDFDWESVISTYREVNMISSDEAVQQFRQIVERLDGDFAQLTLIIFVPIFALFTLLLFRRAAFSYAEHIIIGAFLLGQYYIYDLFLEIVIWVLPMLKDWKAWIDIFFVAIVVGHVFYTLTRQSKAKSYIKVFLAYGCSVILLGISLLIVLIAFDYLQLPTF